MKKHCYRLFVPCFVASLLTAAVGAAADDYEIQGWERVWQDEFDGASVDTGDWEVLNRRDSHNNEKQYYLPNQVSVTDGHLRLTAVDQPINGKAYRSGLVRTNEEWSHGRFEIRADLPTTQGMWPAIWLLPRFADWPKGGEIDILENRGSQPYLTSSAYHYQLNQQVPCCDLHRYVYHEYSALDEGGAPVNFHEGYHDYAVEWEPGNLRFYVDGNRHYTVKDNAGLTVFDTPMSLILNLAVGGDFGGDPDGSTVFPQNFDIDYVRVWQRENGFTGLVNSGFDENGGSINDWQTFNQTGGNLVVTDSDSFTGDSALRLAAESGGPDFAGLYQGVSVEGGETLRARIESLVPSDSPFSAGGEVAFKVEFYTEFGGEFESGSYLGQETIDIAGVNSIADLWSHNEFLVDVPATAVEARVSLVLIKGAAATGAVLVDGLSLVSVDQPLGDYNYDGVVDAADYTVWRDTFGSTTNLAADGDRSGTVDNADFTLWQNNFGVSSSAATTTPEPAALLLSAIAITTAASQRQR